MDRGCDAAEGRGSGERRREEDRRRAQFPAVGPLLLAWVWLERSRLKVIPFQRPLAALLPAGIFLLKCNIHSANRVALSTRVLHRGEASDSPLPSSVQVRLEPAEDPSRAQTLPPPAFPRWRSVLPTLSRPVTPSFQAPSLSPRILSTSHTL